MAAAVISGGFLCYTGSMIELAIPAGSLENALVAFRNGADAVYFGMKDFSARKAAVNFSFEDLAKIKRYAADNGKKIYVTVNTLVDDKNLDKAFDLLKRIEYYRPDGVIIQDLGLAELIRKNFPHLPLHGSTQLAIHNATGVKVLRDLGFERVVLARELSLDEIRAIRREVPDVELKVFIHGAMCYGFSGLCMASFLKTGRSANEGECAQICRTWFTDDDTGRKLYPFSLKDLEAGEDIIGLDEIAIDSAKVEGRLKGNSYVAAVTRFYRALLDGKRDTSMAHRTTFSRERGDGYLSYRGPGHKKLTTTLYTGHIGVIAGHAERQAGHRLYMDPVCPVKDHDGLMYIKKGGPDLCQAVRFPARLLEDGSFLLPSDERLEAGTPIYKISDSSMNEKKPSTDIPEEKRLVSCSVEVTADFVVLKADGLEKTYTPQIADSRNAGGQEKLEALLGQRGEGGCALVVEEFSNRYPGGSFFINPKEAKAIRRDFCNMLDRIPDQRSYSCKAGGKTGGIILPPRNMISGAHTPFQTDGIVVDGKLYITLDAVIYDEKAYYGRLEEKLKKAVPPVMIGLNNIGQVLFAQKHPEHGYFADIYLYLSNRESASLLASLLGNSLKGGYLWLERDEYVEPWPFIPTIVRDFAPPLFISRSCYRHDSLGYDCGGCLKEYVFPISQNGEKYEVYVKDCCTYVSRKKQPSGLPDGIGRQKRLR